MSSFRRKWFFAALLFLPAIVLTCSGCTNTLLTKYRDPQLLQSYRYRLGEQYIDVNGVRVCYQERGTGPTVVILPGLGTSIDFWQQNIPDLAKQFHVVAVDPPGFGKSDKPDGSYDLLWICDNVLAFLKAKGIDRASFIGGSMGGHLAMLIALQNPQLVDKLVLMGASGTWEPPGPLLALALKTLYSEAIVTDHLRRNWPNIFPKMFVSRTPVTQDLFRYQMALKADEAAYTPEGRAMARSLRSIFFHSCRQQASRIQIPVLLIWGEHDQVHTPTAAMVLRNRIPDSRLVVVPGAGHEVMVDKPEVFDRTVATFLVGGTQVIADSGTSTREPM
jgi:4,5:9,10-diseco-3-hydroxy-5,9,17-trioxoandrosta-1(10),2-diene-4-oate hydrolase